ncbi:MAG TPA: hypothetical protein VKY45_01500, partial [Marinilabiliaceae bacterium]|nr:hypothetical protein [Marinilabiliaceae bacterium]
IDLVYYLLGGKSDQYIVKALNECRSVALSYGFNALVVNALYKKKIRRARIQNILNSVGLGKVSLRLKGFLKTKYEIV